MNSIRPAGGAVIAGALAALAAPFKRLACGGEPSPEEREALAGTLSALRTCPPRHLIVPAHKEIDHSVILLEGIVFRQTELADGRRQILAIHVPGDFVDLHGLLLKRLDHDVCSVNGARIALASHGRLRDISADFPHLTRKLWFVTAVDAAIHRQWISTLARPAIERIAHLLCELQARLAVVGLADATGYDLPLTQADLADATALTPVHVNRTLRQLRESGLVNFRQSRVAIGDLDGLRRLARFDPSYLYLDRGDI